jgi:predicted HTH domain antitoxin
MHQHAVTTATALYEAGTLTLGQAADYAGLTDGKMRETLRTRGIDVRYEPDPAEESPVAAD